MLIHKAYKTELKPNNKQKTLLLKHAGCARKAWNWALNRIQNKLSKPNFVQLSKELTIEKQNEFSYMYEVSKWAPQAALKNLELAFKNFFAKKKGYPKYKSKNKAIGSFKLYENTHVKSNKIKVPKIGWLRLKQKDYIPQNKKILSVTISEKANKWFISVLIEEEIEIIQNTEKPIGIDLGIKTLATCSNGSIYENPKALAKLESKIKYLQRRLSKKTKGSNRRKKLKLKLAKLWRKIVNVRTDNIHKATTEIVKTKQPKVIVLENLNVSGMTKNHKLAKAVCDASMSEFRRQIEYKSLWYGSIVQFVDRFFPSSKMCSSCGNIKLDLKLSERVYKCSCCEFELDRDLNAAINLVKCTVGSTGINAHGDDKLHAKKLAGGRRRNENQISTFIGE